MCFITAGYRYSSRHPDAPGRAGRGAAGGRPPRAAGRGGSTPGSSRRPGPWWRRTRDASTSRRGRPRRTAAPPSTGRGTSRWPRTRGSRSRGARWGGSRRARPRRTCAGRAPARPRGPPRCPATRRRGRAQPRRRARREGPPRRAPAVRDDPGGAAPAPARGAPGRREHRPRARKPRLLVLSRAATRESSASAPPDSTSETLRSRHGAAQAPRHEGRRVLRDPDLGGEPGGGHAPLRPRRQPHGTGPAAQARLGVPRGRPGRRREVAGAPRAPPGAVAPGDGRARRAPAPLALPSLRPPDPRQPPLAAPSPGYLAGRARGLPILPISP